ncbi:MAG: FMN-binding protein [Gammaproteobacteria bacterium]|nr:FMN-binding protein [Gammaproteobacteria bacterium]
MKITFKPIATMTVLAIVLGGILILVQQVTIEVIQENRRNEELSQLDGLVDTTDQNELCTIGITLKVVEVKGYGGLIKVAVVVQDSEILGVRALSHSETPGFADVLKPENWLSEFDGNDPQEVDAVTRATITTQAVLRAVQSALNLMEEDESC